MANGLLTIHIWFKHVKTKIKHIYLYHLIQANLTEPSQPNHQSIYWTIRLYIHPWKNITIYISIHWTIRLFTHPSIEPPISQTTSYSLVLSSYINPQTHDIIIKTFKPRIRYINPKLEPHPPKKKHSLTSGPLNIILVSFLLISYDVFLMFSLYK